MNELTKRNIRYICFRIQTELGGGAKANKERDGIMQFVGDVRNHMESQKDFDGWGNFAKTWDVDEKSPLTVILRKSSIQNNWNNFLKRQAKELPTEKEQKKLLVNKLAKKVQENKEEIASLPAEEVAATQGTAPLPDKTDKPEEKQFLQNDLKTKVQERKARVGKKSFWDKLK